ncbi:MAG: malonyl-CoA decarboxylase family protein [Betaproteobacteria bacterium]|nr:malonyl-CoA decarboxylase family protein [Betaproteobacteria bacterium]
MTGKALAIKRDGLKTRRLVEACLQLLTERGEASGVSRAQETLALYAELSRDEQLVFFRALKTEFAPDPQKVLETATAYAANPDSRHLAALTHAAEPPRQELLRRLNRAPGGTRAIVGMRERLLEVLSKDRELQQVDDDFHHLLQSWFNPGFLRIARVDWNTPATLLEQLIRHEAVHEIRGWNDLRRRLQDDRRCFAFFHPALPDEPLIFVEVALLGEMPAAIEPLINVDSEPQPSKAFHTAAFYSISNCQPGLRGVSMGNFLIKQVAGLLSAEFPRVKQFCTLSPIPGFRDWLKRMLAQPDVTLPHEVLESLETIQRTIGPLLEKSIADLRAAEKPRDKIAHDIERLCAAYLLGLGEPDGVTRDPVARFHLNNGARMDRLNIGGDLSDKGLKQSLGMMVNYLYDLKAIEHNHERFVAGKTEAAKGVRGLVS